MTETQSSPTRRIADLSVYPIGLGAMPLSDPHMVADRDRAIATVHAALDAGVTLVDTADIYAPGGEQFGHNEVLVGEAVRSWSGDSAKVIIATKGGITRIPGPDGDLWGRGGRPDQLKAAAEASARRLEVAQIDLYFLHRADPLVSFDEQLSGLAAIRDSGLARRLGLSNVNPVQLQRALTVLGGPADGGIVAVENEFSPRFRLDDDIVGICAAHGLAFLPWSPLGGTAQSQEIGSRYAPFAKVAKAHGVTVQQVSLAWLLALSPAVIPIPGSTRPQTITDSAAAARLALSSQELQELNATSPENISVFPDDTPLPPM